MDDHEYAVPSKPKKKLWLGDIILGYIVLFGVIFLVIYAKVHDQGIEAQIELTIMTGLAAMLSVLFIGLLVMALRQDSDTTKMDSPGHARRLRAIRKRQREKMDDDHSQVPEHYKISDEGEIIELKEPHKRSKKPHGR